MMDFLVDMELCIPPDCDPDVAEDISRRERARAAEILASGNIFKMVWIVPCQRARILVCSAASAAELHQTFSSLPAMPWSKIRVTPLIERDVGSSICIPTRDDDLMPANVEKSPELSKKGMNHA